MAWSHGCAFEDMRSTRGRDASGQANGGGPGHTPVDASTDEAGTPVVEVERRRAAGGFGKQCRPRHTAADDAGVWTRPPAGRGLVSPRPPVTRAIKHQDLVVVVAGETDADRLPSLPRCTPGNAGGASAAGRRSTWTPRHAAHVSGAARVVVIPDADAAGLAHAASVARSVAGTAERVPVVDSAAFGHVQGRGDDVSKWLDTHAHDADLGLEALPAIVHAASDSQPHPPATAAETEHPPPPRTRPPRMPSTPVGGADPRRRAHDETRWGVGGRGRRARILGAGEVRAARVRRGGPAAITDAAGDPNQGGRDSRRAWTAGIDPVRRDGGAAGPRVRAEGKSGVTECARSGLDADTRSRGAATGIVDLPPGEVRPATAGRATRGSVAAPHEDRPWPEPSADARADVDRLGAHGAGHESDEWWARRAYARHGRPSRRFSRRRGGTGGGTPALCNARHAAMGPSVSDPEPGGP